MPRKLLPFILAVAVLAVVPSAARAQAREQLVRSLIADSATAAFARHGYHQEQKTLVGSLSEDGEESLVIPLKGGKQYKIVGSCDSFCNDLDFTLLDEDGKKVDDDHEDDDVPVVTVSPAKAGSYRLKVQMSACKDQPCKYSVGVFAK